MSSRQTLRDFLTTIGSTSTGISMTIDTGSNGIPDEGDDLGVEPNTGRVLLDTATGKSLLGDYTSYVTRKNDYPIAPGTHEAVSPDRGSALTAAETTSATEVFADSRVGVNASAMSWSNSGRFDASGQPLNTIVDKLGGGSAPSGNEVLAGTVSAAASSDVAPGQTPAVVGSFAAFKKYNKFSPTSTPANYALDNARNTLTPDEFEQNRQLRMQIGMGAYAVETTEIAPEINQDDLANIARSMILKAAGWDGSIRPGDAKDPNSAFDNVSSATLPRFPEFVNDDLGVVDAFRAQDSYGMPASPDGLSPLSGRGDILNKDYEEARYTRMHGVANTPDTPFGENPTTDPAKRIQSLQAGLSMIGLAALIDKKMINMQQIVKDLETNQDTVLRGPYYMGSSTRSNLSAFTRALVRTFMTETGIYSYETCVSEGLYACLGYNTESDRVASPTDDTSASYIASTYSVLVKKIAANLNKQYYDSPMGLSQGFWRSVSESSIRIIKEIRRSAQTTNGADYARCLLQMKDSLVVKVMNVFASIGYQRLTIQGITTAQVEAGAQPETPYDIDGYPNAPGTRQMKSRDGRLLNKQSLSWRNSALPSMFVLPLEAMAASLDADYIFDNSKGANPIKGMLGSTLYDKTYVKVAGNTSVIPPQVAKSLEDRLGAEYLPFYFRDLRTNEIIAFHGFLDSLSDSLSTAYNESKGFGRADTVKNYSSTTRSVSFSFTIVATSKEDFDEMWFKINKLTTLAYPQYTRGRSVSAKDTGTLIGASLKQTVNFEQPFSQLVGGTPVVRIRVGDLIKSNYTRSNLGRLFGVGNETFNAFTNESEIEGFNKGLATVTDFASKARNITPNGGYRFNAILAPFLAYAGSPMEALHFTTLIKSLGGWSGATLGAINTATGLSTDLLVNGFINPLIYENRTTILSHPRKNNYLFKSMEFNTKVQETIGLRVPGILKARATPYIVTIGGRKRNLRLLRPVFVQLTGAPETPGRTGNEYEIKLDDNTLGDELKGATCTVSEADLYVDASNVVDITSFPGILLSLGAVGTLSGLASSAGSNALQAGLNAVNLPADVPLDDIAGSLGRTFIAPENNPITRAFEDRMGEGLAGVIDSLKLDWGDSNWETDWNSRAPMTCKVTISFKPIHDIAPGLDSNGFNRAPIYNVGQAMHDTFGNSREDGGNASRLFYKLGGAVAETAQSLSLHERVKNNE